MSQCTDLLEYLKAHGHITETEARERLRIHRLASRVSDLKRAGAAFKVEMIYYKADDGTTKHYARYNYLGGGA